MISLNPSASREPLPAGADLIAAMASSPRPAIIHYTQDDRTELSGRVAVNWATKTTHLLDAYGIGSGDAVLLDLPVTWRSLALALGVAWCDVELLHGPSQRDVTAIVTDRQEEYLSADAELFITQHPDVDSALVDFDDEVLAHADQALTAVPDLIGNTQEIAWPDDALQVLKSGTVLAGEQLRFTPALWWAVIDTWRRGQPFVIVEHRNQEQLQRIIDTERLD